MTLLIDKNIIGAGRTFVIAEIGNNHNGDIALAKKLIDYAKAAKADCVKFQIRHLDEVYRKNSLNGGGEDLGTEYVIDLLRRFELTLDEHRQLFLYCKKINILYLCTAWDARSVSFLYSLGVSAFKVASADLTNIPLLQILTETKKPLILSTGMSTDEEIFCTVEFLKKASSKFVLLHCNSTYPAPYEDINLKFMNRLKKIHPYVGYSGHERGIITSIAATAMGAMVIERHLTLDRHMEGPDHAASLQPKEFKSLVSGIREIEISMGKEGEREMSQGEMINRENLAKSLVSSRDLKKGSIVNKEDIKVRSPGQGLSPQKFLDLLGCKLKRDIKEEDFFFMSDIDGLVSKPKNYIFSRPFGIPVRYHDFNKFNKLIAPNLWEFHFSYTDMDLNPSSFLTEQIGVDFVVHAPELFAKSKLMDLCSPNDDYRTYSIQETQRVIEITRNLKNFFPKTKTPLIVANVGGFSMDSPINKDDIKSYYARFEDSLLRLDASGVEIIPQTMAPFPWHFGGQRYQNIFIKAEEIVECCQKLNIRICFDVSHSMLACNEFNEDFYKFSAAIAPYVAHIHIGDAKGTNGEGLQIGQGVIDFKKLSSILRRGCPNASFIPEIWQGHKNDGNDFWYALEKLENIL